MKSVEGERIITNVGVASANTNRGASSRCASPTPSEQVIGTAVSKAASAFSV